MKLGLYLILTIFFFTFFSCSSSTIFVPSINDPVNYGENDNLFSLLTYNTQALFDKDEIKLNGLTNYIQKEKYDFVVLQEVFNENTRNNLLNGLDSSIYSSEVSRADYYSFPELLYQDAGLFMTSRYPQVDLSNINFGRGVVHSEGGIHQLLNKQISLTTDFLANKSILGSIFQINDSTKLFLFTTHLQAIGTRTHKQRQLRLIQRFISKSVLLLLDNGVVDKSENLIVLLTGDFNADAYDEGDVKMINKHLGFPRDLHKEFNKSKEEYTMNFKLFNFYRRFDYIFAYDSLGTIPLKRVKIESINATDIRSVSNQSVSDHLALKAVLSYD